MEYAHAIALLNALIDLTNRPVGIRFLYSEEDYAAADVPECPKTMNYCQMVHLAAQGTGIKSRKEHFRCQSGPRAFGMIQTPDAVRSGEGLLKLGLYPDLHTQRIVYSRMSECMQKIEGLLILPAEYYTNSEPDVVLLVTTPYNVMRFVQGYTYQYGSCPGGQVFGNRALCSEATAQPFIRNEMCISTLCSGTRYYNGWAREEMALGIPGAKFAPTVEGILRTLNAAEPLDDKERIAERLFAIGEDFSVDMTKSYYCRWQSEPATPGGSCRE